MLVKQETYNVYCKKTGEKITLINSVDYREWLSDSRYSDKPKKTKKISPEDESKKISPEDEL